MTLRTPIRRSAIIIGCGIGGPVMAMALQRAGIAARIYEAHEHGADYVGSFLNTSSNGLDALRTLGADREVLAAGFRTPRMVMWSGTGKRLGEIANGPSLPDGTVSITIKRGLLHRALRDEALRRGIAIEHGKRLAAAEVLPGAAVAHFDDGTRATADLLIGADGLHSRTRAIVDPDCPAPRYSGQLSLGGVAPDSGLAPTPDAYHMIFGRRAFFGYSVRASGEAYWFANMAAPEPARGELGSVTTGEWKRRLAALFAGDVGPALVLIERTDHELGVYPIYDLPSVPIWHRGSIALIGDAAHATSPSSGQGAALAIEDAVVLAKYLRDCGDTSRAFAAYEACRRLRVERVVRYSARIGSTKVAGPVARVFRDLLMPLGLRLFANPDAHAWLYRHHIEWDEPSRLAEADCVSQ